MRCTKDTCMFCAFVCRHRSPKYRSLYQHEKKPILGLFSSMNMHKIQVFLVICIILYTKDTCMLVYILVFSVFLQIDTSIFCRRVLYA